MKRPLMAFGLLLGCAVWSYWSTISGLWQIWMTDDDYSVGLLVPVAAMYPLVAFLLALIFLGEKITLTKTLGLCFVLLGVVLLR